MKKNLRTLVLAVLVAAAVAAPGRQAAAQLPFGIGQQFMRNVVPQAQPATKYRSAVQDRSYVVPNTSPNPGLSFGSKKSSVAISVGPGGVGVGVGTKDTAVAVAVGGGGVGVGVAHESGTAVSVGASDGGVAVGVSQGPKYQTFGAPSQTTPTVQGGSRFSTRSMPASPASRFTGKSGYWSFK